MLKAPSRALQLTGEQMPRRRHSAGELCHPPVPELCWRPMQSTDKNSRLLRIGLRMMVGGAIATAVGIVLLMVLAGVALV